MRIVLLFFFVIQTMSKSISGKLYKHVIGTKYIILFEGSLDSNLEKHYIYAPINDLSFIQLFLLRLSLFLTNSIIEKVKISTEINFTEIVSEENPVPRFTKLE